MISCPLASQQVAASLAQVNIVPEETPASSLEWDNYESSPELLGRKIPIVSTQCSSLEHLEYRLPEVNLSGNSSNNSGYSLFNSAENTTVMDDMQNCISDLLEKKQDVLDEISDNPASRIRQGLEDGAEKDMEEVLSRMKEFRKEVRHFIQKYKGEEPSLEGDWTNHLQEVVNLSLAYKEEVRLKISSLNPNTLSAYERECLLLKKEKLAFEKLKAGNETKEKEAEAKRVQVEGQSKAKSKLLAFRVEYDVLIKELEDRSPHYNRSDEDISTGMQSLGKWEKAVVRLTEAYLAYDQLAGVHGEEVPGERVAAKQEYKKVKERFGTEKDGLQEEDKARALYTNLAVVGEKLDYPRFGGTDGEDYSKFYDKITKAFKHNKVAKSDQVDKIRKYLSGFALTLVPETTESIDKAFSTLKSAFGDPKKVLANRMKLLKAFGDVPMEKKGSKNMYSLREEWFLHAEGVLYDIIQLGKKDEDLAYEAFAESTFNFILRLFPENMSLVLRRVEGTRQVKMEQLLVKLSEFREDAREMAKIYGDKVPQGNTAVSGAGVATKKPAVLSQAGVQLTDRPDCRVCKQLQSEGYGEPLFVDHLSAEITGCPMFIKMKLEHRWDRVHQTKLCGRCLDPAVVIVGRVQLSQHLRKECKGPKQGYTCAGENCKYHMWVCGGHAERNADKLQAQARVLLDSGVTMGMVNVTLSHTVNNIVQNTTLDEAIGQLVRKERNKPGCGWVNKPPEGSPLFLFTRCKGKKDGANLFFDKGCGSAIFRKGIPGRELEGVRLAKGRIPIGGVGGIEIFADEDWLVSLEREDGQRQLIQGLTVESVTVDFPMIDTTRAVNDIKASSSDPWVKSCKVPENVGGVTDALIGIQYDLIHPEPVHTLPSGLTIYRSKLAPHQAGINAAIGGPHSSFDYCCKSSGGAVQVVGLFTQQIEMFRKGEWSAPKVVLNPMSEEEAMFAKAMNECDGLRFLSGMCEAEEEKRDFREGFGDLVNLVELSSTGETASKPGGESAISLDAPSDMQLPSLDCNVCGLIVTPEIWTEEIAAAVDTPAAEDESKIKTIKDNWSQLESGLDIEYRCVKCRECNGCKKADLTEKISLREESEMQLVRESIHLDWEQGKIMCTLPVRGPERDFLTSNKQQAQKILDQQCSKWYKDEANRPIILAAFEKLFKTGDTRFLHQMSNEEQDKFINKEVQYFIPWRVVFQDSVSTPIRPVFDGSSNTRARPDGSGGRSLNDLVVKGKVSTLNLLRLLLRFSIGLHAVTGDLSNFYYSCKLKGEQWNLQRFLFREGLNPEGILLEGVIGALIYGIKCVSNQTEDVMEDLATAVEKEYPELAKFIRWCRYVDDLGNSNMMKEFLLMVTEQADKVFAKVGLTCKGWTWSGEDPPENIAKKGGTVSIAGQRWTPKVDCVEIPIPELHFGTRRRGRVEDNVPRFSGNKEDMDSFIPKKLTRRKIASKVASIFDLMGKLAPVLAGLKVDLKDVVKITAGWDDSVDANIRSKWVENFWKIEQLKGIKFARARMPVDALDSKMRMITLVDAAMSVIMIGI